MRQVLCPSVFLLAFGVNGGPTVAASELEGWDLRQGFDVGLSAQVIEGSFTLGSIKYDWDDAYRYQLNFGAKALSFDPDRTAMGYVSGYGFYEIRSFRPLGGGKLEQDGFGAGVDVGMLWQPMGNPRRMNLGLVPYGSFGISWQSLAFRELPVNGIPDPVNYSTTETRFELGVGLDGRLEIARSIALSLGGGWRWWNSAEIAGNGTIVIPGGSVSYHGTEVYFRGGAAITF